MRDTKMVKTAGEHLACSLLARYGWAPALTRDGIARTDILAVSTTMPGRPTVEIQVKTATKTKKTDWILGEKAQLLAQSEHEWFVFVELPTPPDAPRCFLVPRDHVVAATFAIHTEWQTNPDVPAGKRNAPLSRARINWKTWAGYEERWDLLGTPTPQAAILLPDFVRDAIKLERVGLPPQHPWAVHRPAWLDGS